MLQGTSEEGGEVKKKLTIWDYQDDEKLLIKPNFALGLKWVDGEGDKCETVLGRKLVNGKRVVRLCLSSFIGSIGAQHYYASLNVFSPTISNGKQLFFCGGYGGKDRPDDMLNPLRIEAKRRLTKVEKDMNGEVLGEIGDITYRFNTEKEAEEAAIALFKRKFAPGWRLERDSWDDGQEPFICET